NTKPSAGSTPKPGSSGSGPASGKPTSSASAAASAPPSGVQAGDAKTVKVGECLKNNGTDQAPRMDKVPCTTGTYEVLKRIPGTTDKNQCKGVTGYTHDYFFDSTVNSQDFVLCLKLRSCPAQ